MMPEPFVAFGIGLNSKLRMLIIDQNGIDIFPLGLIRWDQISDFNVGWQSVWFLSSFTNGFGLDFLRRREVALITLKSRRELLAQMSWLGRVWYLVKQRWFAAQITVDFATIDTSLEVFLKATNEWETALGRTVE